MELALEIEPEIVAVDPAETDPELAKKLEENLKARKTEAEVIIVYRILYLK